MNTKLKNTRIVTFKEDYTSKAGTTIYRKGETHAIHYLVVKSLQEKGAKMDVKPLDEGPAIAAAKKLHQQNLDRAIAI